MFTLSDASKDLRKLLIIGVIFIAIVVFILILIKMIFLVKDMLYPPTPPIAASTFGKLPPQNFPANYTNQNLNYTINTLSGYLPSFSAIANVYRIQTYRPDLLAVSRFQDKVSTLGFPRNYSSVSDVILQWQVTSQGLNKTFTGNTLTGSFNISSNYLTNADITSGKNAPNQNNAIKAASEMLSNIDALPTDLDQDKTKTIGYTIINNKLTLASSPSNTQIIEIDFYQKDIDKLPIYYEKPSSSNITVLVGGGDSTQIVAATYIHQVPTNEFSSYPIKTTQQAFDELKKGQGYVASYDGNTNTVSINNVILAYYISTKPQDFLMPVYVFSGDNNFYAYVSAITDESTSK